MPELPEVETVVRALRPLLIGRRILALRADWPRHIDRPSPAELRRRICGCTITALSRRGKYILLHLSGHAYLIVHLRMSGHLSVVASDIPSDKHTHTVFGLDDGRELRFRDPRKFGRVWLVTDPDEVVGELGPEPLAPAFTAKVLGQLLGGRHRILKPLLLDQSFIAGIGNIYADEALFLARLRPTRRSHTLRAREVEALHAGIRDALREGIAREGASIDTYVKPDGQKGSMQHAVNVFRRTGKPCTRCGGTIRRIVLGQRSTHYCPGCQM